MTFVGEKARLRGSPAICQISLAIVAQPSTETGVKMHGLIFDTLEKIRTYAKLLDGGYCSSRRWSRFMASLLKTIFQGAESRSFCNLFKRCLLRVVLHKKNVYNVFPI